MNDLIDRNSLLNSLEKFAPEKHDALVEMLIKKEPTVDAIPLEYIEYEKDRINRFIQIAVKNGDMKEADRLTGIVAVLDAIISNWRYTTGPDWRAERVEE